jgi:protein tyrosine/serine phosphatase
VHHKKFLLTAIIIAAAIAVGISTIVFGKGSPKDSASRSETPSNGVEGRLEAAAGEIAANLPLFHRVDENYLRGSQPLRGGIGTLKEMGVKTLIDLRSIYDHTDDVKAAAEAAGLAYQWAPMSVWNPPSDDEAKRFVSLVTETGNGPFFVFCADGLNRTGEMTAIYRVAQNWSVEKALEEADAIGFNPYYYTLRNYVWDYARKFKPSAVPPTGRRVSSIQP